MNSTQVIERRVDVDGIGVHVREVAGEGLPVVFAHGNPDHSGGWTPFLEALSRPAIAFDLPGWGFSERPSARDFDYSMHGLARFFGRCLDVLEVDRHALVAHDWGSLALIDGATHAHRLDRLVVVNAVPLLPGYRWHRLARWFWRVPLAGELFNLTATKPGMRRLSRSGSPRPGPMPEEFIDSLWGAWRRGIGRPVLDLYRSADPDALAAAGFGLGELRCPALVVWGAEDPYIPLRFGRAYAERLPSARLVEVPGAGHWPWIDRPGIVALTADFLDRERAAA